MMEEMIIDYYKSRRFRPVLPRDSNHRFFMVRTKDDHWRKIKKVIRTPEELVAEVVKRDGVDVYYSLTSFINPTRVTHKHANPLNHIIIDSQMGIDCDPAENTIEGIEEAKGRAIKILEINNNLPEYELEYIAFSGRGFHLVYNDKKLGLPEDYKKRVEYIEQKRKKYILKNLQGINIDEQVTLNSNTVIRVPGSANSRTCYLCKIITKDELYQDIRDLIDDVPFVTKERPEIPGRIMGNEMSAGKMTEGSGASNTPDNTPAATSEQVKTQQPSPAVYVSSQVLGIEGRNILMLTYDLPFEQVKKDVEKLAKMYRLTETYILELQGTFYALCLKTFQKRRLQKIINQSKSINKNQLRKYGQSYVPAVIDNEVIKLRHLVKNHSKPTTYISGMHRDWLLSLSIPVYKYPNQHGEKGIIIHKGVLKNA